MRLVFLLCAAFALGTATGPVEELMDAPQPEDRPDESAALVTGTFEKVEEEGMTAGDVRRKRSICLPGWSRQGSRCFLFIHSALSWVDAETYCVLNGTNLASIHTKEEYEVIQFIGKLATGVFKNTWLGGSDAIREGTWFWSDGSGFNFKLWNRGEPNNHNGPESCLEFNHSEERLWNDEKCELQRPFVCGTRP